MSYLSFVAPVFVVKPIFLALKYIRRRKEESWEGMIKGRKEGKEVGRKHRI